MDLNKWTWFYLILGYMGSFTVNSPFFWVYPLQDPTSAMYVWIGLFDYVFVPQNPIKCFSWSERHLWKHENTILNLR